MKNNIQAGISTVNTIQGVTDCETTVKLPKAFADTNYVVVANQVQWYFVPIEIVIIGKSITEFKVRFSMSGPAEISSTFLFNWIALKI